MIRPVRLQLRKEHKRGRTSLLTPYPLTPYRNTEAATVPFSPNDIPDLELWLDAKDPTTITESGGLITGWTDKSGNAHTQTFFGSPTYEPTHRSVDFPDTYDSYMSTDVNIIRPTMPNMSIFIVHKWLGKNDGGNQIFWGNDAPNGANRVQFFSFPVFSSAAFTFQGGATTGQVTTNGLNNTGNHLYNMNCALNVASGSSYYLDKTLVQTFTETDPGYYDSRNETLYFASGEVDETLFNAHLRIHEILLYSQTLGTTDRQKVENYLYAKWAL